MEISFSEQDGVTVAALSGRLDSATSGEAQQALASGLDGCGRLLLDLEKVAYVSSAGLRVFLMLAKQSRAAGGRLALCSLAPEVKEVIRHQRVHGAVHVAAGPGFRPERIVGLRKRKGKA